MQLESICSLRIGYLDKVPYCITNCNMRTCAGKLNKFNNFRFEENFEEHFQFLKRQNNYSLASPMFLTMK